MTSTNPNHSPISQPNENSSHDTPSDPNQHELKNENDSGLPFPNSREMLTATLQHPRQQPISLRHALFPTDRNSNSSSLSSVHKSSVCGSSPIEKSHSHPGRDTKGQWISTGLQNYGNTCYVNACLQILCSLPNFRAYLYNLSRSMENLNNHGPESDISSYHMLSNLLKSLASVARNLEPFPSSPSSSPTFTRQGAETKTFLTCTKKIDSRFGVMTDQQDSQEFYSFLLAQLEEGTQLYVNSQKGKEPSTSNQNQLHSIEPLKEEGPNVPMEAEENGYDIGTGTPMDKKRPRSLSTRSPIDEDSGHSSHFTSNGEGLHGNKKVKLDEIPQGDQFHIIEAPSNISDQVSSTKPIVNIVPDPRTLAGSLDLQMSQEMSMEIQPNGHEENQENFSKPVEYSTLTNNMSPDSKERKVKQEDDEAKIEAKLNSIDPARLLRGQVASTVRCLECERESSTMESFYELSLGIAQGKDLIWSLQQYFSTTLLNHSNKYRCDFCGTLCEATKGTRLETMPQVLAIHLKRFSWDFSNSHYSPIRLTSQGGSKLSYHIPCPNRIEIPMGWISTSQKRQIFDKRISTTNASELINSSLDNHSHLPSSLPRFSKSFLSDKNTPSPYVYELCGVIYHSGKTTGVGHYTSAFKFTIPKISIDDQMIHDSLKSNSQHDQWVYLDDTRACPASLAEVMDSFSPNQTTDRTAYMIFYNMVQNSPS